jgi:hypothetical protein
VAYCWLPHGDLFCASSNRLFPATTESLVDTGGELLVWLDHGRLDHLLGVGGTRAVRRAGTNGTNGPTSCSWTRKFFSTRAQRSPAWPEPVGECPDLARSGFPWPAQNGCFPARGCSNLPGCRCRSDRFAMEGHQPICGLPTETPYQSRPANPEHRSVHAKSSQCCAVPATLCFAGSALTSGILLRVTSCELQVAGYRLRVAS